MSAAKFALHWKVMPAAKLPEPLRLPDKRRLKNMQVGETWWITFTEMRLGKDWECYPVCGKDILAVRRCLTHCLILPQALSSGQNRKL